MNFAAIYEPKWRQVAEYVNNHEGVSPPLLLACPARYKVQKTKLFVVGQQTRRWYNDDTLPLSTNHQSIQQLQDIYLNKFCLGMGYPSPFWDAVRSLEKLLSVEERQLLWSNLNKVDENGKKPSREIEDEVFQLFAVLADEIRLSNPDVVVFFTGPHFDHLLVRTFPEAKITPVPRHDKYLSMVTHPDLPYRSFRTYHPGYLRRTKMTIPVLQQIARVAQAIG